MNWKFHEPYIQCVACGTLRPGYAVAAVGWDYLKWLESGGPVPQLEFKCIDAKFCGSAKKREAK
jgi:hypothetical protein